jgi:hypothetical protein
MSGWVSKVSVDRGRFLVMSRCGGFSGDGGEQPPGPGAPARAAVPAGVAALLGLVGGGDAAVAAFAAG